MNSKLKNIQQQNLTCYHQTYWGHESLGKKEQFQSERLEKRYTNISHTHSGLNPLCFKEMIIGKD